MNNLPLRTAMIGLAFALTCEALWWVFCQADLFLECYVNPDVGIGEALPSSAILLLLFVMLGIAIVMGVDWAAAIAARFRRGLSVPGRLAAGVLFSELPIVLWDMFFSLSNSSVVSVPLNSVHLAFAIAGLGVAGMTMAWPKS